MKRLPVWAGALALAATGLVSTTAHAEQATDTTTVFDEPGLYFIRVPADVTSMRVKVWGAGGSGGPGGQGGNGGLHDIPRRAGGGGGGGGGGAGGGSGAYAECTLHGVSAGQVYRIVVGSGSALLRQGRGSEISPGWNVPVLDFPFGRLAVAEGGVNGGAAGEGSRGTDSSWHGSGTGGAGGAGGVFTNAGDSAGCFKVGTISYTGEVARHGRPGQAGAPGAAGTNGVSGGFQDGDGTKARGGSGGNGGGGGDGGGGYEGFGGGGGGGGGARGSAGLPHKNGASPGSPGSGGVAGAGGRDGKRAKKGDLWSYGEGGDGGNGRVTVDFGDQDGGDEPGDFSASPAR